MRTLKVALLGCGVVGSSVVHYMERHAAELAARAGAPVELAGIAVRRAGVARPGVPGRLLTTDADGLVRRDDVDVVIELIGGTDRAGELVRTAFRHGASVVTANKALIAADGPALHAEAAAHGVDLSYEAAVAGAVPLLRPLRESLAGDRVRRILGIVSGTTNFILDRMDSQGADYAQALKEATALGYAEADPTADVEGHDAAAKAAILASIAFDTVVDPAQVSREGISRITPADIAAARAAGCTVKLLAVCERGADGSSVTARVHPAMVPLSHPLATVRGAFNAVFVQADAAGELMFYGPGAGGAPTASSVLGDLVTVCRDRLAGVTRTAGPPAGGSRIGSADDVVTRYHVGLETTGRPSALADIAGVLGLHGVPLASVRQVPRADGWSLSVTTHRATERALSAAVAGLREVDGVQAVTNVLRIVGGGPDPVAG